jgi:hypothetical protein
VKQWQSSAEYSAQAQLREPELPLSASPEQALGKSPESRTAAISVRMQEGDGDPMRHPIGDPRR